MDNEEARSRLVAAIATDAIAMVGAGSSRRVGFPLWQTLIDQLRDEAAAANPKSAAHLASIKKSSDLLMLAGECENALGRNATRTRVATIYGPETAPFDDFHRTLLRIPFRHHLVLNYDRVLESTHLALTGKTAHHFDFHERGKLQEFIDKSRSAEYPKSIVHVHGSIGDPNGIILTLDDYDERYQRENWSTAALTSIFTLFPCVFIGCSLGEDDLGPLRFLTAVLGHGTTTKHFAILEQPAAEGEPAIRLRLAQRYRIEPVFYPASKGHQALLPFLEKLLEDVVSYKRKQATETQQQLQDAVTAMVGPHLEGHPEKLAALEQAFAEAFQKSSGPTIRASALVASSAGLPEGDERTPLDDEIDVTFTYVKDGQPQIAIELYRRLLAREEGRLSARLLYRIHANLGNAHYSMGAKEEAAREYLIAAPLRDTRDAKALEGMAYMLRADYGRALELAQALCSQEPEFSRAYWLLLVSLPHGAIFREAEALVPAEIRKNGEVATALGGLAFEQDLVDEAEHYGRLAVESTPEWPDALLNLAATLLMAEKKTATIDMGRGLVPRNPNRIVEAEALVTKAINLLPENDPAKRLGAAYVNRASARRFLGKTVEADEDTREAYRRSPHDPVIVMPFALLHERSGNLETAIQALVSLPSIETQWNITLLLAALLRRRGTPDDYRHAHSLLGSWTTRIDKMGAEDVSDLVQLTVALHLDVGNTQIATEFLASLPVDIFPAGYRDILLARIARKDGDIERAKRYVRSGAEQVDGKVDWFALREAAIVAEDVDEFEIALSLWKKVVPRTFFNADALHVMHVAWRAKDDVFILDLCRTLRQNGIENRDIIEFEISTLIRCREPVDAITLAKSWLEKNPHDSEMRLHLSLLGMERDDNKLIEFDPVLLPSVHAVRDARMGAAVVQVLRSGPIPIVAANYAYELSRRFPDDATAQGALIFAVFGPTMAPIAFDVPSCIGPDCAVVYREAGNEAQFIAIAEGNSNPSPSRFEYSIHHPLIEAIVGKVPGDTFTYMAREHTILAVENKLLFRARDYMQTFDRNFPENGWIRRFTVSPDISVNEPDPKKVLGEMWNVLEADDRRQQQLEALYTESAIPIPLLAQRLGRSVIETMGYLAAKRGMPIRCCNPQPHYVRAVVATLEKNKLVVLDGTAIATIYLLGLHTQVKRLPFRCIIPEAAIQEIREVIQKADRSGRQTGYIGVHQGKLFVQESSPAHEADRRRGLEELVDKLISDCEVVGGSALLEFDPKHRDGLTRVLGAGAADAIAIARKRGAVLWTDDFVTGEVARNEWEISRICTSQVLMLSQNALGKAAVDTATANIIIWGYDFTPLTVGAALKLFGMANWRLDHPAAVPAVEQITRLGGLHQHNCAVTAFLIREIWHKCPKERVARTIIGALLDAVGRSTAGPYIARPLYRKLLPSDRYGRTHKLRRLSRFLRRWRSMLPTRKP